MPIFHRIFRISTTVLAILLGFSWQLSYAATNVGYVDLKSLLDTSPQAVAASERLRAEFEPREQQLIAQKEHIKTLKSQFEEETDEDRRLEMELELRRAERDLRRGETEFREELNVEKNNEYKRVRGLIIEAIGDFATVGQWDLIVSEGVLFASPQADLTAAVLQTLEEKLAESQ